MKLTVDPESDALYLRLHDAEIVDSEEVAPGIVLDYDGHHHIVGIELLHLSRRGSPVEIDKLVFEILHSQSGADLALRESPPHYGKTQPSR